MADAVSSSSKTVRIITHVNVSLYALCFWIQIGTLPYLTKKLDVDPITFGYLQTTFATVQLLGGPIYGRFGDLFGSKYALLLAFFAAFMSYFLLGLATTVFMVFLSRLPSVCMHAMHGAQMVVTDISDPNSRSAQLGKLGLSYGIGMVIGPIVGGLCTKYAGEQTSAFVAAAGSAVSFVLILLFLPVDTKIFSQLKKDMDKKNDVPEEDESQTNKRGVFDISEIIRIAIKNPKARSLLFIKTVSGIPIGVLHSMFSVLAISHFHLSAEINGYVLSYVGVVSMISQGLIVGRITNLGYGEWSIISGSIITICISYVLLLTIVTEVLSFCIALFPMVVAGAVFTTVMSGMLTKSVEPQDTGTMLGIGMATNSLIRTVAPTIGGFLLERYGFFSFGVLGILFNAPLVLYIGRFI
ncbi:solute carrier family 22 member 18-like [Styela clava]